MPYDRSVDVDPWASGAADCDSGTDWAADPVATVRRRRSVLSAQQDSEGAARRAARRSVGPDPWYLWLARDLGRVARWARSEAGVVSASARAAAATTREVTRSVLQSRGAKTEQGPALDDLLQALATRLAARADADAPAIENDESFWDLLDRLQRWRDQAAMPASVAPEASAEPLADPARDEAADAADAADAEDEPVTDAIVAEEPEPPVTRTPGSEK